MNKYSQGKIYKIVDNTNDDIYIGSTIETLSQRLSVHKSKINYNMTCKSSIIIKNNNYDMILVENYPCESREQLELRERYYIESIDCINIKIPGRTQKEYQKTEQYKLWRKENRKKNKDNNKYLREYKISWGGDKRFHNNLLSIDINLFR